MLIECTRCGNETRTAKLLSAVGGEIMVSGPAGSGPQPVSAQVCVACGHIDLFAPQHFELPAEQRATRPASLPSRAEPLEG